MQNWPDAKRAFQKSPVFGADHAGPELWGRRPPSALGCHSLYRKLHRCERDWLRNPAAVCKLL